MSGTLASY
ncbi:hypothetical protein F383_35906 [Gossypium arboreum]|uniref:Uncharacterized protein n=1 Tax=Gossypium arboreum TaxID=29729 RepID=A0A0B0N7Q8_GOSAR|nr:hypothetical protein F383_35906 [Gossypium arboreum]